MTETISYRHGTQEDTDAWGRCCAEGFAHRSGDPNRFLHKFLADPTRSAEDLILAATRDKIVGSFCVLQRRMRTPDGIMAVCSGIADVCTHPEFRGRGIARKLMDQAQAKAASQASSWGVLHAASEVSKFYYSYGYRFVSTLYSKVSVGAESSETSATAAPLAVLRTMDLQSASDTDIQQLTSIYEAYSSGFVGFAERDAACWRRLVRYLLAANNGALVVAERSNESGDMEILAYCGLVSRRGVTMLAEYGAQGEAASDESLFRACLGAAARTVSGGGITVDVKVPAVVLRRMGADATPYEPWSDHSWMWKPMQSSGGAEAGRGGMGAAVRAQADMAFEEGRDSPIAGDDHLIWFTNSF